MAFEEWRGARTAREGAAKGLKDWWAGVVGRERERERAEGDAGIERRARKRGERRRRERRKQ